MVRRIVRRRLPDWNGKYESDEATEDGETSGYLPHEWPMLDNNNKQIDEERPCRVPQLETGCKATPDSIRRQLRDPRRKHNKEGRRWNAGEKSYDYEVQIAYGNKCQREEN